MNQPTDPADHLPLSPTAFALLAALATGPRPGFEIMERAAETGVRILGPGTLYRLLRDLREREWIARVDPPAEADEHDERRQYHALTPLGRRLLSLEAERLSRTIDQIRVAE